MMLPIAYQLADLLLVVGARLGEATTDGYEVPTLEHPGQTLVHIHPDPEELGRVYRTDLALCCAMDEFAECAALWDSSDIIPFDAGAEAHAEWLEWSTPQATGATIDLGLCVGAMRDMLPADTIICNGAGNFAGWWHRYWRYTAYPGQLAPTCGAMGYGVPAAVAAALRFPDRTVHIYIQVIRYISPGWLHTATSQETLLLRELLQRP